MPRLRSIIEFGTSKIICMIDSTNVRGIDVPSSSCVRYDGIINGEWADKKSLFEYVSKAVEMAESRIKKQVRNIEIGIPASFAKIVPVTLKCPTQGNRVSIDDVNRIVQTGMPKVGKSWSLIEARSGYYIDDTGELYIDPPINLRSQNIEACICYMYARASFINEMVDLFDEMHIDVDGFLFENISQAMRFIPQAARDKCCILVDVGYEDTAVSVVFGDAVLNYEVIHCGGSKIVTDLQTNLGIDSTLAENLKRGYSFGLSIGKESKSYGKNAAGKMICFDHKPVRLSIEKSTLFLVNEILYVLEDCRKFITPTTPIFMMGAGLKMRNVDSFIAAKFGRKVNIQMSDDTYALSPVYNTAVALLDNRDDTVYHLGDDAAGADSPVDKLRNLFRR